MKLRNILILTISLITFSAQAQQVKIGIKGGPNISTLAGDFPDIVHKLSFHAGTFLNIHVSNKIILQPELIYSNQGAVYDIGNDEINLAYLNLPMIAKIEVSEKFNVQVGPQLGILLSGKFDFGSDVIDIKDAYSDMDVALTMGVGFKSHDNVTIDLRYNYGFTNIVASDIDAADLSITNQVIQVSLGFIFN